MIPIKDPAADPAHSANSAAACNTDLNSPGVRTLLPTLEVERFRKSRLISLDLNCSL